MERICDCGFYEANQTFECAKCLKDVCYCKGQADANFDLCDDCAYEVDEK
jgi:hypothetical protein